MSVNTAQSSTRQPNPIDLNYLEVVEPYVQTIRNQKLTHYDTVPDERSRLTIFTTKINRDILSQSRSIFSSGTSTTAPNVFTQLFTVHGLFNCAGRMIDFNNRA